MTTLVKIQRKGQMTLPSRFRSAVGMSEGDMIEISIHQGKLVLTPKVVVDRPDFPNADDEYTPAQRRIVDAQLAEGLADIKAGSIHGPFNTANEMIAHMKQQVRKRVPNKKVNRSRR